MAKDSSKLIYAGDGEVYLADVGTAMPSDVSTALSATWLAGGLGYMAEGGVTISANIDATDVPAWQTPDPIDSRVNARSFIIQAGIMQFNQLAYQVLFGGGTWSGTTLVTYASASGSSPFYKAMVVETIENTKKQRFLFPKVSVEDTGELILNRPENAKAAVSFKALNTGSGNTMTILSDVTSLLT